MACEVIETPLERGLREERSEGLGGGEWGEAPWGCLCRGSLGRLLYKTVCEITHGTEKAGEKFNFYFLTKTEWVLKD